MVFYLLAVSTVLQVAVAVMALRLIHTTNYRFAWTLITAALILMALDRAIPLYHLLIGDMPVLLDPVNGIVGLVLSALMALGVVTIGQFSLRTVAPVVEEGHVNLYTGNISERKRTEEALRASEERFRRMFQYSPLGMALVSPDFRFLHVNEAFCRMLGYTELELLDRTFQDVTLPEDQLGSGNLVRRVLSGEMETFRFEKCYLHKDGNVVRGLVSAALIRDTANKPLHFIAQIEDITERKRAEAALQQSEAHLREAQRIGKMGSWTVNLYDNSIRWSDGMYPIYGVKKEEFSLSMNAFIELIHPDDSHLMERWIEQVLGELNPPALEFRAVLPNGVVRYVLGMGELETDEAGNPKRVVGTAQDITERKRAEDEIRQLNDKLEMRVIDRTAQLQAANKELEAFSYSVSHDLRAPLRALDGFSRILIEDYGAQLPDEAVGYLNRVQSGATQMGHLIDDLLRFSRLNRHPLELQSVNLQALVDNVWSDLEIEREGRVAELTSAKLPVCQGDPALLKQVFSNLLSNALKYSRSREVARIEIGYLNSVERAGESNETNVYFVRDNGVGFDMQFSGKLFGVFQRLHRQDEYEGTGVGLAIVQRIIARHGGRIWAEAELDKGATFYLTVGNAPVPIVPIAEKATV